LIGKSLFICHSNPKSEEIIKATVEKLKNQANEVLLQVNGKK